MNKYLCLHLHFYQPPRENPWLGDIELQESAYPFHDWNERINNECYRPNGFSRILNAEGHVIDITNNYATTSFNFGPTLLSWLEEKDPDTYQKILEGDRLSLKNFNGHGSAIAQGYNHLIMPLANRRDKETQIIWGLKDFEKRFKRTAESLWLPETAVDIESLEIMADHGLKYVILAPRQARAIRSLHTNEAWKDVTGEQVDPLKPYLVRLPSGRSIAAFFYKGPISKAVAFEGLLHNGETFAHRLLQGFDHHREESQLLHIATDGETYGHHHRHGDMALSYALWYLQQGHHARITNYGEYLELHPPQDEAQIFESSSWSCEHGVQRWYRDCGCATGAHPAWNQEWRTPLRQGFDFLRDHTLASYEKFMHDRKVDPWAIRNDYIDIILNNGLGNVEAFLGQWFPEHRFADDEITKILKALEGQKYLLFSYTSCAWFFDDISGIETVQNLQYAFRAIELCESVFHLNLKEEFLKIIEQGESNIESFKNGKEVFERFAEKSQVDFFKIGVHFAVASLFKKFATANEIYNSKITLIDFKSWKSGKTHLVCGHARIRLRSTLERQQVVFAALHLGDHNISVGVKRFENADDYFSLVNEVRESFERGDFYGTVRVIDRLFPENIYSLADLVKDERLWVVDNIKEQALAETEESLDRLYEQQFPLMRYLANAHMDLPRVLLNVAEFIENRNLRQELTSDRLDIAKIRHWLQEAEMWHSKIDWDTLALDLEKRVLQLTKEFNANPSLSVLQSILALLELNEEFPFGMETGLVQNWFFAWTKKLSWPIEKTAELNALCESIGRRLKVHIHEKTTTQHLSH
ncbi:hypothetical protein AZI86_13340 [Bdellovibrio bacteriovorus]|uniref:Glycoside hydrolase family 57 N-terminal domain-containing protein n=1 Tax=Bdellovibrio bacteriovorus TaxID=959 RepID=A0A150WJA9_BDEBC|nr:DUF3536 domain-containing protein [Bdellovibrio bacteriovorus]KYG63802.1 hypothetical protein AZI86_13340 [Bdellovibrio bacteriovorus]